MNGMEERRSFLRNPKWQIILIELSGVILYIYLTPRLGGPQHNQVSIIIDTFLFYLWLVFWHFFFAQFIFPVQTVTERIMIFKRLWLFLIGRHGPAVLVENGGYRQRKKEVERHRPGVALIDTASAAMLRTDDEYTRPAGPGVVFTTARPRSGYEYFEGVVDLRPQTQVLGPRENEDPFQAQGEKEKDGAYQERQRRRYRTSGLTRNGIEVVPNILVFFQLNTQPGLGGTQFGYNGFAVRLAITGEGIDPDLPVDAPRQRIAWRELPATLAANVWRESIGMFTVDELFQELGSDFVLPTPDGSSLNYNRHPTGFEFISSWLKLRMTQEVINELDSSAHPTGARVFSQEYKILKDRGIRVNNISITNLRFPETVEKELVQRWESTWYQRALLEREMLEQQLGIAQKRGMQTARTDYAVTIARGLKRLYSRSDPTNELILSSMVLSSLQTINQDPQLLKRSASEASSLLDLIAWIHNKPASQ
jgi:hypothetical protein